MRRCSDPDSALDLVANGVDCGLEVCKNRPDGSQIVRRREEVWRFQVDKL